MSFFVQTNQDKMEIANENLRADMERWRVEKKNDLKRLLIKMADQHILYYQEVKRINSNSIFVTAANLLAVQTTDCKSAGKIYLTVISSSCSV